MKEETVPVPPYHPALSDDDVVPLRGLSHFLGSTKRKDWNPPERSSFFFALPLKIVVFRLMQWLLPIYPSGTMIAAPPRRDAPAADRWLKFNKNSLPAVPRKGPETGVSRILYDFHGAGVNPIGSCPFLQSRFFHSTMESDLDKLILHSISSSLFREFDCSSYNIRKYWKIKKVFIQKKSGK
jgi:hypothetical protein